MADVKLSSEAYRRAVLHACRYPARPVMGLLVGPDGEGGENKAKGGGGKGLEVSAAVPLCHSYPMAPLLETALSQAQQHYAARGMAIRGVYVANELVGDVELSGAALRVANAVQARCRGAVVAVLDNRKAGHLEAELAVHAFLRSKDDGRHWTPTYPPKNGEEVLENAAATLAALQEELAGGTIPQVADFEAHLDCPSVEWLA